MIVTKDLVILNLPKTGSTFVRNVVKDIYFNRNKSELARTLHKFKIKNIGFREILTAHPMKRFYKDQHGCFDQVPNKHKSKPILSVVRDPYTRIESSFRYKWWAKNPFLEKKQIEQHLPNFPDLSFKEFLKLYALESEQFKRKYNVVEDLKIGKQSIQFIRLFFKNHKEIFHTLNKAYILDGHFKKDICNVTLLKNENLNEDLASFFSQYGFSQEELDFIKDHKKINVTKNEASQSHIDQDLIDFVNEYEWPMLEILATLGIDYKRK